MSIPSLICFIGVKNILEWKGEGAMAGFLSSLSIHLWYGGTGHCSENAGAGFSPSAEGPFCGGVGGGRAWRGRGSKAGCTLGWACWKFSLPALSFPRWWKEPSYCKDNYYSIELACISLLGTSFSASVHHITHLTNALWAKNMIRKQKSGILKSHKKKKSMAGLCQVSALWPDCYHVPSSSFPACFSRPVPLKVTHSKSSALPAVGRQHPYAMFHLIK